MLRKNCIQLVYVCSSFVLYTDTESFCLVTIVKILKQFFLKAIYSHSPAVKEKRASEQTIARSSYFMHFPRRPNKHTV